MEKVKEKIIAITIIFTLLLITFGLVLIGKGIGCCGVAGAGNGFLPENYDNVRTSVNCADEYNVYMEGYIKITLNESVKKHVRVDVISNNELLETKNITDKSIHIDLHHNGIGGFYINILNPNNNSFRIYNEYSVRITNIDLCFDGILWMIIGIIGIICLIVYYNKVIEWN